MLFCCFCFFSCIFFLLNWLLTSTMKIQFSVLVLSLSMISLFSIHIFKHCPYICFYYSLKLDEHFFMILVIYLYISLYTFLVFSIHAMTYVKCFIILGRLLLSNVSQVLSLFFVEYLCIPKSI